MKLQVNRIAQPVTVLGPGRRLGVWVQGCQIHCPGCSSVDTWDGRGGRELDTAAMAVELARIIRDNQLSGITLTGGEPTEQGVALADLVVRLRAELGSAAAEVDVLMFTGRTATAAARWVPELWAQLDAAICGPYRQNRPSPAPLIASSNQELVRLTPLGRKRFDSTPVAARRSIQTHLADGDIALIGLPNPGDLPRLEEALLRRGVLIGGRSWQTP